MRYETICDDKKTCDVKFGSVLPFVYYTLPYGPAVVLKKQYEHVRLIHFCYFESSQISKKA